MKITFRASVNILSNSTMFFIFAQFVLAFTWRWGTPVRWGETSHAATFFGLHHSFFLHEGRSAWQSPKNVGGYNSSGGPALINIRQKALSSSVGFLKRMTSRSPRSLICDPIHLHFDRLYPTCLIFGERFCPTFSFIPRSIPINSNKKMPLPPFKGCFDVSSLLLLRGEKDLSVDVYTE